MARLKRFRRKRRVGGGNSGQRGLSGRGAGQRNGLERKSLRTKEVHA